MLIKHHSNHIYKCPVLPFNNAILLRDSRSGELMLNAMVSAESIKEGILELGAIIATNSTQGTLLFYE